MNKLKLEHLAPYLPYELDVTFESDEYIHRVVGLNITERGVELISPFEHWGTARIEDCMPILRPLSDLAKEIEHNGERFVPRNRIYGNPLDFKIDMVSFGVVQVLISYRFDIFGLIDKGLAIDINTVKEVTK